MKTFYILLILYIALFIIDYFILKKIKKFEINEYAYLKRKNKLKLKQPKHFKIISSLLNSLIMFLVSILALAIKTPLIITFLLCFIVLLLLIYSVYEIYGRILKKHEKTEKTKK